MNVRPQFRLGSLEDCDLANSQLEHVLFEGTTLSGASFSRSNLRAAEFYGVMAFDTCFEGCELSGARFLGGNFTGANFAGAILSGAFFGSDNLGGSVNISGANFDGALLEGAVFESVQTDDPAHFPPDFRAPPNT